MTGSSCIRFFGVLPLENKLFRRTMLVGGRSTGLTKAWMWIQQELLSAKISIAYDVKEIELLLPLMHPKYL